ncbi:MAG: NRDE family protein, partial [Alphaproteobacteria bacterium]
MCTLALFSRVLPGLPLVVAANRDEFLARPTASPGLLSDAPQVFGGRDLVAGG